MKKLYPTLKFLVMFAALLILLLLGYVVLFFTADALVSFIYMCSLLVLLVILAIYNIKKFITFRTDLLQLIHQITSIINSSFRLNNMFFHFFKHALLKMLDAFSETFRPEELIDLKGLEEGFRVLQEEESYFASDLDWQSQDLNRFFSAGFRERVVQYTGEVNYFFDLLQKSSQTLVADIKQREDVYRRKEFFHQMIVEYSISTRIFSGLLDAIIFNSSRTGESVSARIVEMKQNIDLFLGDIGKWQHDFLAKTSRVNFDTLMNRYQAQKLEFSEISRQITENYEGLDLTLTNFVGSVGKINENIQFIKEIADSINILSINASIEAARQGSSGRGFKVIAGEIKKLSGRTENFVTEIMARIQESNKDVAKTSEQFRQSTGNILEKINAQKEKIDVSYEMLRHYYENFNRMIGSMENLTTEINKHIDKFYIILQHYDIEEQELSNLRRILDQSLSKYSDTVQEINETMPADRRRELADTLLSKAEKIVTTRLEEETLQALFRDYGIRRETEGVASSVDIELF